MTEAVVIIGGGQAGGQVALALRQLEFPGTITVVGEEPYAPYERPPLSKSYLAGEVSEERLFLRPQAFYAEKHITLMQRIQATRIDRAARGVQLSSGETLPYTKLVLATGGRVRKMSCPGADLPGIHYLRNIDDVRGFRDRLAPGAKLVVVGGGYIGLEVAAVAIKRGCRVTVLEMLPLVLNRVVAPEMSRFYAGVHRAAGVDVRTSTGVTAFEGRSKVERVICGDTVIDADLVVIGIGIVPNVELAAEAGLAVDNGIVVDECTRTVDPDVFAAGDCTNHPNSIIGGRLRLESVPNALAQGKAAAGAIMGLGQPHVEVPWFWSDQYDLKLQMAGLSRPGDRVVIRGVISERKFSACYLRDGVFVACQAVNMVKDFIQSKKLIAGHARPDPENLANLALALKDL
ncbi:MAG: pyridine nucleotide-disulfide oxidoreductase [Rhodospirillaceae bacterium]|nr:pyridine nucleotide-disulfide oxidoreductase [Rhodospirillaceae bacterium]